MEILRETITISTLTGEMPLPACILKLIFPQHIREKRCKYFINKQLNISYLKMLCARENNEYQNRTRHLFDQPNTRNFSLPVIPKGYTYPAAAAHYSRRKVHLFACYSNKLPSEL